MKGHFEGEGVNVFYKNGIVVPKDFEKYETHLQKLIDYVDKIIKTPNETWPAMGLWEIADLKFEICANMEDIDRYFEAKGEFHKKELGEIKNCLEGRLKRISMQVPMLSNLLAKVKDINP